MIGWCKYTLGMPLVTMHRGFRWPVGISSFPPGFHGSLTVPLHIPTAYRHGCANRPWKRLCLCKSYAHDILHFYNLLRTFFNNDNQDSMVTWFDRLHNSWRLGSVVIASQGSASAVVSLPTRWGLLCWSVCWRSPQQQWRTGSGKHILNICPGMHVFNEYLYQQLFINPLYSYQCSMRYWLIGAEWRIYVSLI